MRPGRPRCARMPMLIATLTVLAVAGAPAMADALTADQQATLDAAIDHAKRNGTALDGLIYTRERLVRKRNEDRRETVRVDRTKPLGEQQTLLSINGRPPTEEERAEHRETRRAIAAEAEENGRALAAAAFDLAEVDLSDPRVMVDDGEALTLRFPYAAGSLLGERFESIGRSLLLDATIGRDADAGPRFTRFAVFAPEPFRYRLLARITDFQADLRLAPLDGSSRLVPASSRIEVTGFLFFRRIERDIITRFRDYRPAVDDTPVVTGK